MINLTKSQFQIFNTSSNVSSLVDIKSVLKCLRFDGLSTPKLNSKKIVIMEFWQELVSAATKYAANTQQVTPKLFNKQLKNVGARSVSSLTRKLA